MPLRIIIDLDKNLLANWLEQDPKEKLVIELDSKQILQMDFNEQEINQLKKLIDENREFETIRIELPGLFSFKDVLTDKLINEKPPRILFSIKEKYNKLENKFEYF